MKQAEFCNCQNTLMASHSRAIVHLRGQVTRDPKRLGLILGAGVSQGISNSDTSSKLPSWKDLITTIARDPKIKGEDLLISLGAQSTGPGHLDLTGLRRSLSSAAQMLSQSHRDTAISAIEKNGTGGVLAARRANTEWMQIVHDAMYSSFSSGEIYEGAIKEHPYLHALGKLIKKIPLTINFNFDDSIERLLFNLRNVDETHTSRGYQTIWEANSLTSKDSAVIYHPNGVLPFEFSDGASPEIVLSDDAFHDQVSNIASGRSPLLTNYLHTNTCLLIGLSLDDISLQQTLRQNAVSHPGHIHYAVHFLTKAEDCPAVVREAIFKSNFECFGLYTFFVDNNGIRALIELITATQADFKRNHGAVTLKFIYYLVGPVGVGKTTAVKQLQSLKSYDEWVDRRLPELAIPERAVVEKAPSKKKEIDDWVAGQFFKKNYHISEAKEFIHLVDRCPLDPLTFGESSERPSKAKNLLATITKSGNPVEAGHILFLTCAIEELRHRKSRKHKHDWDTNDIGTLANCIKEVYGDVVKSTISTDGRTPESVAKEIARTIFLGDYRPQDIGQLLRDYEAGTRK